MTKLDRAPEIVRLASELKADVRDGPVGGIIQYCKRKLNGWVREAGGAPRALADLERLVCAKLRLEFEEVWTDQDLERVVRKYVAMGEHVFATLRTDLSPKTFAALIERQRVDPESPDRYIAVVDCRGEKAFRRFFTRWHEIAHLMTLTRQLELPFHRSTSDRSPLERLMDVVAGEIGFHDALLTPALNDEIRSNGRLSFAGVERVRQAAFPEASFSATLNACVARCPHPVILIEAGIDYTKTERERLESNQLRLIPAEAPEPKLRVLVVIRGEHARASRFRVDRFMTVPPDSIVSRRFFQQREDTAVFDDGSAVEELGIWRHSDGTSVGTGRVRVATRKAGDRILALIQPDGARRASRT